MRSRIRLKLWAIQISLKLRSSWGRCGFDVRSVPSTLRPSGSLGIADKTSRGITVGTDVTDFEDDTGSIADEAMSRLAETDEVFADESALYA